MYFFHRNSVIEEDCVPLPTNKYSEYSKPRKGFKQGHKTPQDRSERRGVPKYHLHAWIHWRYQSVQKSAYPEILTRRTNYEDDHSNHIERRPDSPTNQSSLAGEGRAAAPGRYDHPNRTSIFPYENHRGSKRDDDRLKSKASEVSCVIDLACMSGCICRNTAALQECAVELRRIRERN